MNKSPMNPKLSQPDNQPMTYGVGVSPSDTKGEQQGVPKAVGKSSAPYQAGHGRGQATDPSLTATNPARENDDTYGR